MGLLQVLVSLLVAALVIGLAFWLLVKYVVPALPPPWGRVVLAVVAIIIIVCLFAYFLGDGGHVGSVTLGRPGSHRVR